MKRQKLIQARVARHKTQQYIASALGVDADTVSRWEQGKTVPRGYHLEELCHLYGMSAAELGFEDSTGQCDGVPVVIEQLGDSMKDLFSSIKQDLTTRLMSIVVSWSHRNSNYGELQRQIDHAIDDYNAIIEQDDDFVITRRNALRSLVLLPIEFCGLSAAFSAMQPVKRNAEDILRYCAAGIAGCWHVRKGRELALVYDAISLYIPVLKGVVSSSPESHRQAAASLLVQCLLLRATLAMHVENTEQSEKYLKEAVKYSEISDNPLLRILAWRTLGATYYYMNRHDLEVRCFDQAAALLKNASNIPMLAQSYVYAGLATTQALLGKSDNAMVSLAEAHRTFFASSDEQPPIWVKHHLPNLLLNDALTHYHLGKQKEAIDSLTQIDAVKDKSETIRVQSLIERAKAEVSRGDQPRDMDYTILYWTQGIQDAKALRSEQWFTESRNAYAMLQAAWPSEPAIKGLKGLIEHW